MPPSIAKFFTGADAIQLFVGMNAQPTSVSQGDCAAGKITSQAALIALHPVFSHTAFRLIEMLSITQHGEFLTSSRKGNFQTIVEVGGHICQRQLLNEAELHDVQQLYQQIEAQVSHWRLSSHTP
jgi:hypothetical protein